MKKIGAFPSLLDMACESVQMGAYAWAQTLLDFRQFLVEHFDEDEYETIEETGDEGRKKKVWIEEWDMQEW